MKQTLSIHDCLKQPTPPEGIISVQGWIKTRRDSKAGFSFIQLKG